MANLIPASRMIDMRLTLCFQTRNHNVFHIAELSTNSLGDFVVFWIYDFQTVFHSQTKKEDKSLLDPPEIDAEIGPIRDTDEVVGWIPGVFPSIFQNETGDPYNFKLAKTDLVTWGPHVLRSRGWAAQAHMTFMYWWTNMCQRIKALGPKKWFV